jgi:TolB-like protein/Flp pilus assembly protein TadD
VTRWARIEELFHAALERVPAERESFLREACGGDEELRREVLSLLAEEKGARRLMEEPAADAATQRLAVVRGMRLGPYEVEDLIGSGGMGEVYRARDTRLGRDVAIKVLPPAFAGDAERLKRFEREARAAAALNHPNVVTVHDVGAVEGAPYVVMERLEGETLRRRLGKEEPPPLSLVLDCAAQVARGLSAAHEKGIVHRDLKPENLFLTGDGRVKILDFGLAKLRPEQAGVAVGPVGATTSLLSEPGAVMGTVAYMSPEQIRGLPVDARTDIYALGNVLFELATGRRPFAEAQGPLLTDAILHQAPPSPRQLRPELPAGLDRVILKALEKEPERRYRSARELLLDLERLSAPSGATAAAGRPLRRRRALIAVAGALVLALSGAAVSKLRRAPPEPAPITSLAVLPLQNFSTDPGQEVFVDGMTDALIAGLAQIRSLKVISRTSVMQYKEASKPLPQIAQELGVEGIVEGSVTRSGGRVRITAQLIDARQDRHLWASQYERDVTDVLALQSEVVGAIAGEIRARLTPQEREHLGKVRPVDPAVYDATMRGRAVLEYATREAEFRDAIRLFEAAAARDPGYAPAWAGLGEATWGLAMNGFEFVAPGEVRGRAIAAAERALTLDETLPEAHNARAVIALDEWDFVNARRHFERALDLRPGYAAGHNLYGQALAWIGLADEAQRHFERARDLDPFSPWNDVNRVAGWYYQGQHERVVGEGEQVRQRNPALWILPMEIGYARLHLGQPREAVAALEVAEGLIPDPPPMVLGSLGLAYGLAGRREDALAVLGRLEGASRSRYVPPTYLALVHSGLGRTDEAFRLLDRALDERTPGLFFLALRNDIGGAAFGRDPRWKRLVERLRPFVRLPSGTPDPFS